MRRLLLSIALFAASPAFADGFVLVVSASAGVKKLSTAEARDVFNGKTRQWAGGQVVQLVLGAESAADVNWIASTLYATSPKFYLGKVRQEVFKGEMKKPLASAGDEAALALVGATEGAVAAVSEAAAAKLPAGVSKTELGP